MSHDRDAKCECVRDHRPRPCELHEHHIWPKAEGGPDTAANLVWVCPNTHANIHDYLRLLLRYGGRKPKNWRVYPAYARTLAERGYRCIVAGAMVE